jgi:hypothetical protein
MFEDPIGETILADAHGVVASAAKHEVFADLETAASTELLIVAEQTA